MGQFDNNGQGGGAHTADYYAQYESTITNGEARIPICICVDTSSSMSFLNNDKSDTIRDGSVWIEDGKEVHGVKLKPGVKKITKMDRLQKVLSTMITKMRQNDIISKAAVICIVSFDQFADCFIEFTDVNRISSNTPYNLEVGKDKTNVSKGIRMSLERLDQIVSMNSNAGNDRYVPVLVFMSDGAPTDGSEAEEARIKVRQRSEDGKLNVIPISICGDSEGERWLRGLSKESKVYHMDNEREFESVFAAITERIKRTAMVLSIDEQDSNLANQSIDDDTENTLYGENNGDLLNDFLNSEYNG